MQRMVSNHELLRVNMMWRDMTYEELGCICGGRSTLCYQVVSQCYN